MPQIARIEMKNCLGITEKEIQAGQINLITGGNEKGKTSILEVIEKGLQNTQRRAKFIREGEQEAFLLIELNDGLEISRRVHPDGKTSSKVTKGGASVPKPESYLKSLLGEGFGFNPVDFMGKKDKDQTEILLSLISMRVTEENLQEWFGEIPVVNLNQHAVHVLEYLAEKYFYDRRTLANGEVKNCLNEIKAIFEQLPDNYNGDDWREVNIGELWGQVKEGQQVNTFRAQAQEAIDSEAEKILAIENKYKVLVQEKKDLYEFKEDKVQKSVEEEKQTIQDQITEQLDKIEEYKKLIEACEKRIEGFRSDLAGVEDRVVQKIEALKDECVIEIKNLAEKQADEELAVQNRVENARKYLKEHPEIKIEPLEEKAQEAEEMKGYINLYDNMKSLQTALTQKQAEAARLDECVQTARKKPADLLQQIKMPIKGLGINEQMQITIDGLPITNLSTSRQIKLALDIARATAGPLKMICVDRFESLDDEQREIFFKEVEGDGFQYFITEVTGGDLQVDVKEAV